LQMISAFATIANDGIRAQPHIIKEIRRSDDQPKTVTEVLHTQVVTAETAKNLKTMLRQVVLTGTGKRAQLDGYAVAGKTGTAWKFNSNSKSVDSSKYVSSFIGMAPAEDPQIVVAVVMDEPRVGARDGGMVSAPVFREIAQQILEDMKVPKDPAIKQNMMVAKEMPETDKPSTGKDAKTDVDPKQKAASPGEKDITKPPKKTNEKRLPEPGKLTAAIFRPRDRARPYRYKG